MILSVSGHRPDKLGGYTQKVWEDLMATAQTSLVWLDQNIGHIDKVLTGCAQGWDTAIAQACKLRGTPYVAYVPFRGQESRWSLNAQAHYTILLREAESVYYCDQRWAGEMTRDQMSLCYMERNRLMVTYSDHVLLLWNGSLSGGTYNAVRHAKSLGRPSHNAWGFYEQKRG